MAETILRLKVSDGFLTEKTAGGPGRTRTYDKRIMSPLL